MKKLLLILTVSMIILGSCTPDVAPKPAETPPITPAPPQEQTYPATGEVEITSPEEAEETVPTEDQSPREKEEVYEIPQIPIPEPPLPEIHNYEIKWESNVQITRTGAPSFYPTIGASQNTVHIAWVDQRDGGQNREIYYNRSTNNGDDWQDSDTRITNNPLFSVRADFAVNMDTVYLFWRDNRDGNFEDYFIKSPDGGLTWESEIRITNDPGLSGCPFPVANGDTLNLFFRDNRTGTFKIYQKRSIDAGATWSEDVLLTPDGIEAEFPFPAISGNTIHLVWRDTRDGNAEIYYKSSTDGGASWTADQRLTDNTYESEHPKIVVQGSNLHLVWCDDRDGNYEVYYKKSTDGGHSWSDDRKLTLNPGDSFWPSLAVSGDIIHLVWSNEDEYDGIRGLYYRFSSNGGRTWHDEIKLTNCVLPLDANIMGAHILSVVEPYIHVVFNDDRTGKNEIYYKRGIISLK